MLAEVILDCLVIVITTVPLLPGLPGIALVGAPLPPNAPLEGSITHPEPLQ